MSSTGNDATVQHESEYRKDPETYSDIGNVGDSITPPGLNESLLYLRVDGAIDVRVTVDISELEKKRRRAEFNGR